MDLCRTCAMVMHVRYDIIHKARRGKEWKTLSMLMNYNIIRTIGESMIWRFR